MLDIAIIGGGPAGLTAGLYAARGGAVVTLFEELFVGGQVTKTHLIENYPGFPDGLEGFSLGALMEQQASRFGLKVSYETVERLELDGPVKKIHVGGRIEEAKAVILCMGAVPQLLGDPREAELTGKGVAYCATCDGAFYKGRTVAVVGGGDTAIADALYLTGFAEQVHVIHRRDALRATKTLQEAAFKNEKITFHWDSVVKTLQGAEKLEALGLQNKKTGEESLLPCDGLFVAVGIEPKNALIKDQLPLDPQGAILTNERMETGVPGVYAAGDLRATPLRQVVTACADGAIAATEALEYIRK
ncbi:MAG: thioredoxin-disulfide reductase [Clostridia bacterium]|nr:thioredoxin-disulfide reductase [Clostridia bacterium]